MKIRNKLDWLLRRNEKVMQEAVQRWFVLTTKQIQRDLRTKFVKDVAGELTDWEYLNVQGQEILKPATLSVMQSGGQEAYNLFQVHGSFDVLNVEAVKVAEKHCAKLVREVNQETKNGIRTYIREGIRQGQSMDQVARELRPLVGLTEKQTQAVMNYRDKLKEEGTYTDKKFQRYADKTHRRRMQTIARTETARAQNMGYMEGLGDLGVERAEFSATSGACDECNDLNGQEFPLDEARGIIPVHPNCRCALLPVVAGEATHTIAQAQEALPDHIEGLLERLAASTDPAEGRKIRKALRKLGHKGGLKGPKPAPPITPVKPPVVKPPELVPKPKPVGTFAEQQKEWVKSISISEENAFLRYTVQSSQSSKMRLVQQDMLAGKLNVNALSGEQIINLRAIKEMEIAIERAPVYPKAIYRGMSFKSVDDPMWRALQTQLDVGKTFSFRNIQSFSTSEKQALVFARKEKVHVVVKMKKAPKRSAVIRDISDYPKEEEILVGSNSKYKVLSREIQGKGASKTYVYTVEEVTKAVPKLPKPKPKPIPKPKPVPKSHFDDVEGWEERLATHKADLQKRIGFDMGDVKWHMKHDSKTEEALKKFKTAIGSYTKPKGSLDVARKTFNSGGHKGAAKKFNAFCDKMEDIGGDDVLAHYNKQPIRIDVVGPNFRAGSDLETRVIKMGSKDVAETYFHELGHMMETDKKIRAKAHKWVRRRGNRKTMPYNKIVTWSKDTEMAYKDKFIDPYIGKIYGNGATEVMSVGLEQFTSYANIAKFAKRDFDHFAFIHGVLTGAI